MILDDATSEIYYAQLVEEESTRTVMAALREVVETQPVLVVASSVLRRKTDLISSPGRRHASLREAHR